MCSLIVVLNNLTSVSLIHTHTHEHTHTHTHTQMTSLELKLRQLQETLFSTQYNTTQQAMENSMPSLTPALLFMQLPLGLSWILNTFSTVNAMPLPTRPTANAMYTKNSQKWSQKNEDRYSHSRLSTLRNRNYRISQWGTETHIHLSDLDPRFQDFPSPWAPCLLSSLTHYPTPQLQAILIWKPWIQGHFTFHLHRMILLWVFVRMILLLYHQCVCTVWENTQCVQRLKNVD